MKDFDFKSILTNAMNILPDGAKAKVGKPFTAKVNVNKTAAAVCNTIAQGIITALTMDGKSYDRHAEFLYKPVTKEMLYEDSNIKDLSEKYKKTGEDISFRMFLAMKYIFDECMRNNLHSSESVEIDLPGEVFFFVNTQAMLLIAEAQKNNPTIITEINDMLKQNKFEVKDKQIPVLLSLMSIAQQYRDQMEKTGNYHEVPIKELNEMLKSI